MPEEQIGERIRQRRNKLELNFEQLSRLTAEYDPPDYKKGLTAAMLARYERGFDGRPVMPGARELRILCQSLDVSADWLLFGVNTAESAQGTLALAKATHALIKLAEGWQHTEGAVHTWGDMERAEKLRRARRSDGAP